MSRFLRSLAMATALLLPAAAMAQQPTIKIGSIFAMTGPIASWGASASEGIRDAIDEVNKAGGLDVKGTKYKLEMVAYDDAAQAGGGRRCLYPARGTGQGQVHFHHDLGVAPGHQGHVRG